jgi:hypothetical protein
MLIRSHQAITKYPMAMEGGAPATLRTQVGSQELAPPDILCGDFQH